MTTQITPQFANVLLAVTIAPEEIGQRIRTAREQRGWTQLRAATEMNISPSSIQRWERGALPPVRELMRIAPLLGVEIEELVEPEVSEDRDDRLRQILREELATQRAELAANIADSFDRLRTDLEETVRSLGKKRTATARTR